MNTNSNFPPTHNARFCWWNISPLRKIEKKSINYNRQKSFYSYWQYSFTPDFVLLGSPPPPPQMKMWIGSSCEDRKISLTLVLTFFFQFWFLLGELHVAICKSVICRHLQILKSIIVMQKYSSILMKTSVNSVKIHMHTIWDIADITYPGRFTLRFMHIFQKIFFSYKCSLRKTCTQSSY